MSRRWANTSKETADCEPADVLNGTQPKEPGLFRAGLSRDSEASANSGLAGQAVLVVTGDGRIAEVLQAPDLSSDLAPSALIDTAIDELWPGDPADRIALHVRRAIRSRTVQSAEYRSESDHSYHDFVFVPYGRDRVMIVARDVSERRDEFSRIEKLAYVDDVTKLPNRQFLFEELERCTNLLRLQEGRAAVICFDIAVVGGGSPTSKQFDSVFIELASRMLHELRGANEVDVDDYERYSVAARTDHSQFGVVLPVIESGADAEGVTRRLIDTLQQPIKLTHREIKVIARAGIALFPQDGTDSATLYMNAAAAMEDARTSNTDPYKFHSGTVRLRALQRQDLQHELRAALERDEFAVEFLPIVSAADRKFQSLEALLRWPENVFGPQSIAKIISIAENTGLILPIGDWVLRKSCEALKSWHACGWPDLRVSVNLSTQEFSRVDLADRIADILESCAVDARYLDIEITEYSLFRDAMRGYAMCANLKTLGVGITVDDYGTGACSLAHVARSPVDAIKIDNSFVANAVSEDIDRDACAAIAAMAKRLGKRIIAEGVETEQQAEILVSQGCDELQGFLICRPSPAEDIKALLEETVS